MHIHLSWNLHSSIACQWRRDMGVNKQIGRDNHNFSFFAVPSFDHFHHWHIINTRRRGKKKKCTILQGDTHKGERSDLKVKVKTSEVGDSDHTWSSKDYTDPLPLLPLSWTRKIDNVPFTRMTISNSPCFLPHPFHLLVLFPLLECVLDSLSFFNIPTLSSSTGFCSPLLWINEMKSAWIFLHCLVVKGLAWSITRR